MGEYNGWKNYETWCVALWLSNDEGLYNDSRALDREYRDEEPWRLADAIRAYVDEMPEVVAVTEGPASFVVDLLGAAMSEVDWLEIAENWRSEDD